MLDNSTIGCDYYFYKGIPIGYIFLVSGAFMICANILTVVTIYRTPSLHTNANILVASEFVTGIEIGVGCVVCGCFTIPSVRFNLSEYTKYIDLIIVGGIVGAVLTSCSHNAIIAIDRYLFVAKPFFYLRKVTTRLTVNIVTTVWVFHTLVCFIPLTFFRDDEYHKQCIFRHIPPMYGYSALAPVYFTSLVIIIKYYWKITSLAIQRRKSRDVSKRYEEENQNGVGIIPDGPSVFQKSVKFFIVMSGIFFLLTFTSFVVGVIDSFIVPLPDGIYMITLWMSCFRSGTYFVLLAYMRKDFRQALKKQGSCGILCRREE